MKKNHVNFMTYALDLALKAKGMTSPNPVVGAVIVKNHQVIAEGFHRRCGEDHAEIMALKKAGIRAKGATLYVTLEPCFHFGRTPPCVDAVIKSGIKQVVIAHKDPNPLTAGKSIQKLKKAGIKVEIGILENECRQANEVFIKYITRKMPFVVAKSAQSLDGKIALANGQSKWITSKASRDFARKKRDEFDAIMVGANTVKKDNPRLTGVRKDKVIKKIVVDSALSISPKAKLFSTGKSEDCYLLTTKRASSDKIKFFQKKGVHIIICPVRQRKVDMEFGLRELAKKEISSVLIEGGSKLIGSALNHGLVDKLNVYIAPKIIGDAKAVSSVVNFAPTALNRVIQLKNLEIKNIGEDIFLSAYVHRNR